MRKREGTYAERLIHILPLIAGCLLLAGIMILLVGHMVDSYSLESNIQIVESRNFDGLNGNNSSLLKQSSNGLAHIVNAFIYYYNQCGYYDRVIAYMQLQDGWISVNGLRCAFVELYLLLVLLLIVPVIIRGRVTSCYIVSGILLALILLVGRTPDYFDLMLLVLAWIYLNLAEHFIELKGIKDAKEFWREFPMVVFPFYGILLAAMLVLSVMLPTSILPEANKDTKDAIFTKLQEIQLVSNQYEENKRKSMEQEQSRLETEAWELENEDQWEEDQLEEDQREENQGNEAEWDEEQRYEEEWNENMDENDPGENLQQENGVGNERNQIGQQDADDAAGQGGSTGILSGLTDMFGLGNSSETGTGFSLRLGGGISRGRTDQTGNLSFHGKTVLKVYSEFKPEETMYIRLFYGEDYEDNQWKQTSKEQFDNTVINIWQMEDYDGDGQQDQVWTDKGELKESAVRELTMSTFYGLNNGSLNRKTESEFIYVEYSSKLSKSQTFGGSRFASGTYPEVDSYLGDVCKEVPQELHELFTTEFSDVFPLNLDDFSSVEAASKIEQLLEETAYYTLSPGKAPGNKDFITWFLTENKRGYCMHFASAGVMMLREAGISARYAEGYSVPESAWVQQEDGTWCAEVKDSNAHAWAEIYSGDGSGEEYWRPVELTPAYNGELAGVFAGQSDVYVGRMVVPGMIIKILKVIFQAACVVILVIAGWIIYRKGTKWYEKRLLHTGSRRQDVKNMMRLLLKKASRKNRKVRQVMKQENLTLEMFKEQMGALVSEFSQNEEAAVWFNQLSDYTYKAAFGAYISKQERLDALKLYRKLRREWNSNQKAGSDDDAGIR